MGPFEVGIQVVHGVADLVADDAVVADLAGYAEVPNLPGIQTQQFGGLLLFDGDFSFEQDFGLVLLLQQPFQDLPDEWLQFLRSNFQFSHCFLRVGLGVVASLEFQSATLDCVRRAVRRGGKAGHQEVSLGLRRGLLNFSGGI